MIKHAHVYMSYTVWNLQKKAKENVHAQKHVGSLWLDEKREWFDIQRSSS